MLRAKNINDVYEVIAMNIYSSSVYMNDLKIVQESLIGTSKLKGKSILVTGATGLIGSAIIDLLLYANERENLSLKIYGCGRSEDKVRNRFKHYFEGESFAFVKYDACKEINFNFSVDYIIHCASNANPIEYMTHPVETMISNFYGMYQLLQYSKKHSVTRVLYVSSSEVYGKTSDSKPIGESSYGYIDLLNPRSSYSIGKQSTETLCASFCHEYGSDIVIARPGHIYGPTATKEDSRVSSMFAYNAAYGKDIIMKSKGTQLRSYCYCLDCASAILTILLKGERGEAYNISNPNSIITIFEMATMLADFGSVNLKLEDPTELEKNRYNPMLNSSLNSEKLEQLGWKGIFDARTGLKHTVQILREAYNI